MRRLSRWPGLPSPPRCLCLGCRPALAYHRSKDPVGAVMASRCRSNTRAYRRMTPSRPASGPGQNGPPYSWLFQQSRGLCSTIMNGGSPPGWPTARTEVKALFTDSSVELLSNWLRMPERMPVIKRILNCCRWGLPFKARARISSGAMRTAQESRGAGRRRAGVLFG
jgi:hypothetical protein